MMSLRQKAAIVATVFFVSTMLQGCTPDPKECQGAEGKDMETCKQCVEKANKNSDASAKAVALKACAKVAKEASGAKKTDTTGATTEAPKNDANQGDSTTQNSESLQQATTTPKVQVENPKEVPTEGPKEKLKSPTLAEKPHKDVNTEAMGEAKKNEIRQQLVLCDHPCNAGELPRAPKADPGPAQVVQQNPIQAAVKGFQIIKSIFALVQERNVAASPKEVRNSGMQMEQRAAVPTQLMSSQDAWADVSNSGLRRSQKGTKEVSASLLKKATEVTENAVGNAAKASLAVASSVVQTSNPVELGANLLSTGPSVGSARARQKMAERVTNGASLDQDKSSRGVESQPVADAAQVTGGTNVAQERSSTREGQEGPLNIVEEFQQVANTAQASDSKNGAGASIEALHQSTDIQPQASDSKNSADAGIENLHQSTEIQPQASDSKNGAGASIEALHQSTEIQPQATDLKNSAGASIDTLHQSTETQPQATESKNGAAASIETLHQSTEIHPQVDGLLHSTRPVLANGLASHATEDPAEIKQTIEDPEAIAEVSSQPWPPSDERYKKGGKHDSLAQESLVDADDFYVHKQAATDTHKQEPFRAIVGTSGKVARVGKPRHDVQAKMQ